MRRSLFAEKEKFSSQDSLPELGPAPIWDVRSFFVETNGIPLAPDDTALWCPATQRIFIRTSQVNLDLIGLEPCYGAPWVNSEITIVETNPEFSPVTMYRVSLRSLSGAAAEVSLNTESLNSEITSCRGKLEPIIGPDGQLIEIGLTLAVEGKKVQFQTSGTSIIKNGESKSIWQGPRDAQGSRYECMIRVENENAKIDEEKTKAAKAIETRLEKLK